jgi:hypothetical protein
MSSASDFTIAALSPEDAAYYDRQRAHGYCLCSEHTSQKTCTDPVRFETSYTYTSGDDTRRSIARRHICLKHARLFCARHWLALPDANEPGATS